ncbi:hypothetical protein GE09DRAFT_1232369 [Coniochaeta sp. 2T2.1]|nr:hypothetical protein GE09DRAFT_1232369 [Coniochaeta sp. 2T2.1]
MTPPGEESPPKIRKVGERDPAVNPDDQQPEVQPQPDQREEDQQPEVQPQPDQREEDQQPAVPSNLKDKILVSAESMETLGFLFLVKGRRCGGKELRETDLRKFLADVGLFLKSQSGNKLQFEPGRELAKWLPPERVGTIRIDPISGGKLPAHVARDIGDSMYQTYGWIYGSFVERPRT